MADTPDTPADPAPEAKGADTPVTAAATDAPAEAPVAPDVPAEETHLDADAPAEPGAEGDAAANADADSSDLGGAEDETPAVDVTTPPTDARYQATGKRKTSVARVIVTPGDGTFWVNGRTLEDYFPRHRLRTEVLEPLDVIGATGSYHVRARMHGGGVSSQAGALRHGIAKALAEIHPTVRTQLKGKGLLKLDARQVERKKAGLKKARKRPQFSKR